ncbi:signal peptidase I [Georgenia subflava]|nr:signal peptidase I [Georgenia subflava]
MRGRHTRAQGTASTQVILRRVGNAVLWLLLATVAAVAFAVVLLPRLLGWVPLSVLSGSMEPAIPTGSQVVVEAVESDADAAELALGDVITFMPFPDDTTLVTHRIVGRTLAADGTVAFTTKGDANDAADPWTVTTVQIRGVAHYHVPYAGHLATVLDGDQKRTGAVVGAAALFSYAGMQLLSAVRERRRRGRGRGRRRKERVMTEHELRA